MSGQVRVTLPDGNSLEVARNSTCADVAAAIGPGLAKSAVGAYWNGELTALEERLLGDGQIRIITRKSPEHIRVLRHSAAHLCAAAVIEIFPDAQLGFGPATDEGFYYDFLVERPFTPEDLEAIEAKMRELVAEGLPFERIDELSVPAGTQCRHDNRLRLAAGEQGRTMRSRQHSHLNVDSSYRAGVSPVDTCFAGENAAANRTFLEP